MHYSYLLDGDFNKVLITREIKSGYETNMEKDHFNLRFAFS